MSQVRTEPTRIEKMDRLVSHVLSSLKIKDRHKKTYHKGTAFEIEWLTLCNYWRCIRPGSEISLKVINFDNYRICRLYDWHIKVKRLNVDKKHDEQDWSLLFKALKRFYRQADLKLKPRQDLLDPKLFDEAKRKQSPFLHIRTQIQISMTEDGFLYLRSYGGSLVSLSRSWKRLTRKPNGYEIRKAVDYLRHPKRTYDDYMHLQFHSHTRDGKWWSSEERRRMGMDISLDVAKSLWYSFNSPQVKKRIYKMCFNDEVYTAVKGFALSYVVHKTGYFADELNQISAKVDSYATWGDDDLANLTVCDWADMRDYDDCISFYNCYEDAVQQLSQPTKENVPMDSVEKLFGIE